LFSVLCSSDYLGTAADLIAADLIAAELIAANLIVNFDFGFRFIIRVVVHKCHGLCR